MTGNDLREERDNCQEVLRKISGIFDNVLFPD